MSSGLSPKYPLYINNEDGAYALNKNYEEMIRQNVLNLIMTNPGERIMDPNFGVGLRKMLFQQSVYDIKAQFSNRLSKQIDRYMPFLSIINVNFDIDETRYVLSLDVKVKIKPLSKSILVPVNVEEMMDV